MKLNGWLIGWPMGNCWCFNPKRPNRGRGVAGRTGAAAMGAVLTACLTMLAGCVYMAGWDANNAQTLGQFIYVMYVACAGCLMVRVVFRARGYTYRRSPT